MKIFAVETIDTFRLVYFVQAESAEHAMDTVACEETKTFLQSHLGEHIVSVRPVSDEGILSLIQETEQPTLTAREFADGNWKENLVHVVDYKNEP